MAKTSKRKAKVGETIIITNARKGWNGSDEHNGLIMHVNRVMDAGVYTDEIGPGMYIAHEGYEVLLEK